MVTRCARVHFAVREGYIKSTTPLKLQTNMGLVITPPFGCLSLAVRCTETGIVRSASPNKLNGRHAQHP